LRRVELLKPSLDNRPPALFLVDGKQWITTTRRDHEALGNFTLADVSLVGRATSSPEGNKSSAGRCSRSDG